MRRFQIFSNVVSSFFELQKFYYHFFKSQLTVFVISLFENHNNIGCAVFKSSAGTQFKLFLRTGAAYSNWTCWTTLTRLSGIIVLLYSQLMDFEQKKYYFYFQTQKRKKISAVRIARLSSQNIFAVNLRHKNRFK